MGSESVVVEVDELLVEQAEMVRRVRMSKVICLRCWVGMGWGSWFGV